MAITKAATNQSGTILIILVVLTMMIAVMFVSLIGVISQHYKQSGLQAQDETAFQIAEAGLNYARWRLAHNASDFSPVQHQVYDQEKGVLGTYELTFDAPQSGSTVTQIYSIGYTASAPDREILIQASYGKSSFAQYATLVNDNIWITNTIHGPVHSNGGIRMDGQSDSAMTSAKNTYTCQSDQGCNVDTTKPGVWGVGGNTALWKYPVPPVDFGNVTTALLDMKASAQSANTYFGPSGAYGYHVLFNPDNTYSLYKVTGKTPNISSYFADTGYQNSSYDIDTQTLLSSGTVPANGVLFFEDTVWIEGTITTRVTVASGVFPENPSTYTDIILNGNVTYGGLEDGSRMLGVVSQGNVLIPYSAAQNDLELDGSFVAEYGRFGRRKYDTGPYMVRNTINTYGMIASNHVPVTTWVDGSGNFVSGYQSATNSYDPHLVDNSPPFFPTTGEYKFLSWEQK